MWRLTCSQRGIGIGVLALALVGCFPLAPRAQPTPTVAPSFALTGVVLAGSTPVSQPVAQAGSQGQPPPGEVQAAPLPTPVPTSAPAASAFACPDLPAGWTAYRVQQGDTLYRIALAHGTTIRVLARANCLADPRLIYPGQVIFLPVGAEAVSALSADAAIGGGSDAPFVAAPVQAVLPVVILRFAVDQTVVMPGQTVRLTWTTQASAAAVQIGWLYRGQVVLVRDGLPASGVLDVAIPADGRRTVTFILQVSDGLGAASAFATVQVSCTAGWFFRPAPEDVCPHPAVSLPVVAQQFEGGLVLALLSLGRFYVLLNDGVWLDYADAYRPGMPYRDPALSPPADRLQPEGAIGCLWRSDATLMTRLGWATRSPVTYNGTFQRAASPDRETVYLVSPGGDLLILAEGLAWQSLSAAQPGTEQ